SKPKAGGGCPGARERGRFPRGFGHAAARCPRHGVSPHAWPRDTCERGILGTLAVSFRAAGVQVEVPSTCPWHLVNPELLRLPRYEHHRDIVATVRADSLQLGISGDVRRARDHALAG